MSELRPTRVTDGPFLLELYRDTHRALGAAFGLQAPSLLAWQHETREAAFRSTAGTVSDTIILHEGAPVGRCLVSRAADQIRLIDLAVVSQWQDHEIGTEVLRGLAAEACAAGLPLRLHVEVTNSGARRLYERLGFRVSGTDGPHHQMELARSPSELRPNDRDRRGAAVPASEAAMPLLPDEGSRPCSTPTA